MSVLKSEMEAEAGLETETINNLSLLCNKANWNVMSIFSF